MASTLVRLGGRHFSLWVDEGMSVGIASRSLTGIPPALIKDGSPPLYYLLLHGWMGVFGSSEAAVRALSLVFAVAAVPVAWWAGRSLFGRRAGWVAAVLVAFSSYLTVHSREARMYSLVVLLGLVAVTSFLQAFALRRRRWVGVLVVSLAALVYTHYWGLFMAAAMVVAAPVCVLFSGTDRRAVAVDAGITLGGVGLLFAPWVPSFATQVRQTGAPWSRTPTGADTLRSIHSVLGSRWVSLALAVAVAVLVVHLVREQDTPERTMVLCLGVILVTTMAGSWLSSQLEPSWSPRYFGVYLPPLVLLAAVAFDRAGKLGLAAVAAIVVIWCVPSLGGWESPSEARPKSNVRALAARLAPTLQPGDVVMASQLEQVPLLRHYLGPDLRYADPTGVVVDPTVADWRDALARMTAARPAEVLGPLVADLEPGRHIVLACPRLFTDDADALWYRLMDRHCASARTALAAAPGVEKLWGPTPAPTLDEEGASMAVTLYRRTDRTPR
ncbi:MAG TPA: glycosyltransferase family 39 protein [Acidimicrobiales bacterium]|nr:glycosyltransferase family 39 protein [Acidimicrobiales bacterium]